MKKEVNTYNEQIINNLNKLYKIINIVNNHNSESKYMIDYESLIMILKGDKNKTERVFENIVMKYLVKTMELEYIPKWRFEDNGLNKTCYSIAKKYYPLLKQIADNSRTLFGLFNKPLKPYDYISYKDGKFIVESDRMKDDLTIYLTNDKQEHIYNISIKLKDLFKESKLSRWDLIDLITDKGEINYYQISRYGN